MLKLVGHSNAPRPKRGQTGALAWQVQFGDVELYRWLESVGLTQRKSLTLGPIAVPDEFFSDLVRGLLDGDGSILNFVHGPTKRTYPAYRYERLWIPFLEPLASGVAG